MKNLSNEGIIFFIERCNVNDCLKGKCINNCPLWKEYFHSSTGEDVGSFLEKQEE